MKYELSTFDEMRMEESIKMLTEKYPDDLVNNDIILDMKGASAVKSNLIKQSAKRNKFSNISLIDSNIVSSAFTGSQFKNFIFKDCNIKGNSFVSCIFEKSEMSTKDFKLYTGNNFSNSYVNQCKFFNLEFKNSSWISSNVEYSDFENCIINSCTLEGTVFNQCIFTDIYMSTANLDYMILNKTQLNNVVFPFYQFAYIIGAADYLMSSKEQRFYFSANGNNIKLSEYKECIPALIDYYYSRNEYFPLSNLLYATDNIEKAKEYISIGVVQALNNNDYRMIKHYCIMAKHYDLLEYSLTKKIKSSLNSFLLNIDSTDEQNVLQCLIKTSEINNILDERTTNKTFLQFEIQTNIDRTDEGNQEKINEFINSCKYILDNPVFDIEGHTIKEISYCPVDLVFQIVGNVANLLAIAGALQQFVFYIKTQHSKKPKKIAKDICRKYNNINVIDSDSRIELAKTKVEMAMQEIKNYRGLHSGEEYDNFIAEITQKIIGDVDNILDKDMLVMKVDI